MVATLLILSVLGRAPDIPPVRVWLGSGSLVVPGDRVRVYVQTTGDGYVIVLHRRPDGSVQVLFPGNPATDPFTRAGTYEIRAARDAPAFSAAAQGSGVVLAAFSSDPFRFGEFVSGAVWNAAALALSWVGSDAEASLTDMVQRMLGDGSFNYDLVMYTVASPRTYTLDDTTASAPTPAAAECAECSYYPQLPTVVIDAPILVAFPRVHHRPPFRGRESPVAPTATALAPYRRGQIAQESGAPAAVRTLPPIVIVQRPVRSRVQTDARPAFTPVFPARRPPAGASVVPHVASATPVMAVAPRLVAPRRGVAVTPSGTPARRPQAVGAFQTAGWRH